MAVINTVKELRHETVKKRQISRFNNLCNKKIAKTKTKVTAQTTKMAIQTKMVLK